MKIIHRADIPFVVLMGMRFSNLTYFRGTMIATTINMHLDTLVVIADAASKLKTSRRDIVVRLLMRIMQDIVMYPMQFTTVRYQPDDRRGRWHCFSIKFSPDENEFFTDLR